MEPRDIENPEAEADFRDQIKREKIKTIYVMHGDSTHGKDIDGNEYYIKHVSAEFDICGNLLDEKINLAHETDFFLAWLDTQIIDYQFMLDNSRDYHEQNKYREMIFFVRVARGRYVNQLKRIANEK